MSNGNILEQAGQLVAGHVDFASASDLIAYSGMAAPSVLALGLVAREYFKGSKPAHEGLAGAEDAAIDAMEEAPQNTFRKVAGRRASMLALAAATSVGIPAMLEPNTTESVVIPGSEAVFVVDLSRTMTETEDMGGLSRLDAASFALSSALPELPSDLRIGVVTFGASSEVTTPLTTDRNLVGIPISDEVVGQPYSEITDGIDLGQSTLQGSDNPASDVMFVLTDGTVDNPTDMTQSLIESADAGTEVIVIATGTKEGTYTLTEYDPAETASAVSPEVFAEVGDHENIQVFEATSSDQIREIIKENIDNITTQKEKKPFNLFRDLAIGFGGLAVVREFLRGIRRK